VRVSWSRFRYPDRPAPSSKSRGFRSSSTSIFEDVAFSDPTPASSGKSSGSAKYKGSLRQRIEARCKMLQLLGLNDDSQSALARGTHHQAPNGGLPTIYTACKKPKSLFGSAGFVRWQLKPASSDRLRSSSCPYPVTAISLACAVSGSLRSVLATTNLSIPGRPMSHTTASGRVRLAAATPSGPECATVVSCPKS
jgi:hypothetical protein